MGLFDKIKDNAKDISMRAIEETESELNADMPSPVVTPDPDDSRVPATNRTDELGQEESEALDELAAEPTMDEYLNDLENDDSDLQFEVEDEPEQSDEPETRITVAKSDEKKPKEPSPKSSTSSAKSSDDKNKELTKEEAAERPKEVSKPATKKADSPPNESEEITVRSVPLTEVREVKGTPAKTHNPTRRVLDVTPPKAEDPKQAIFARERAAMGVLATQRRMNGAVPLFVTSHLNFKTRVFIDRIEYSGSFGKNVLPIEQVAWIKLRSGGTGVIIETTAGKRVVMVVKPKDRLEFADAVLKVQAIQPKREKFRDTQTVRLDQLEKFGEGVDEIEKLAKLFDKGIITKEEFDAKKKQILGI